MTDETDSQGCRPEAPGITPEVSLEPMDVGFGPAVIEDLRERLRRTRHPAALDDDWAKGVPASWTSRPPGLPLPAQPWTPAEQAYAADVEAWSAEEGSYAHQHATKPATIGAALHDSPAGLAAWIGEKIVAWSSVAADGQPAFPRALLLATLTLYWATGTITSSMLPYWNYRHIEGAALQPGDPSPVPTAVSIFGGERVPFPRPPRELAERFVNVSAWQEHDHGGHFPGAAEPELLARTLREVFRPSRRQHP